MQRVCGASQLVMAALVGLASYELWTCWPPARSFAGFILGVVLVGTFATLFSARSGPRLLITSAAIITSHCITLFGVLGVFSEEYILGVLLTTTVLLTVVRLRNLFPTGRTCMPSAAIS